MIATSGMLAGLLTIFGAGYGRGSMVSLWFALAIAFGVMLACMRANPGHPLELLAPAAVLLCAWLWGYHADRVFIAVFWSMSLSFTLLYVAAVAAFVTLSRRPGSAPDPRIPKDAPPDPAAA